jgi:hypothetical protein
MRQVKYTRPPDWVDPFQDTTPGNKLQITTRPPKDMPQISTENNESPVEPLSALASSRSMGSPLTYRSTGSAASQASRLSARSRPPKLKELRKSHLDQLNRSNSGVVSLPLTPGGYGKRSISSNSLKSDSLSSEGQRSESRSRGPFSKLPSRLLATCQRSIAVQNPQLLFSNQRPRTTAEFPSDSHHSASSHALTLPPIRSTFHFKEVEVPQKKVPPDQIDVTIMCSIVSTAMPSTSRSSSSLLQPSVVTSSSTSSPSITFTSGSTEINFPLTDSHLYVTVDGVYDTSLHCEAQIPLHEFLHFHHETVESDDVSCGGGGKGGGDADDATAELTVTTARSSIVSTSSMNSAPHLLSRLDIEEISRDIVHQISLNYDDTASDYSIILPDEGGQSQCSDDRSQAELLNGMTGDEAFQILNGDDRLSFSASLTFCLSLILSVSLSISLSLCLPLSLCLSLSASRPPSLSRPLSTFS